MDSPAVVAPRRTAIGVGPTPGVDSGDASPVPHPMVTAAPQIHQNLRFLKRQSPSIVGYHGPDNTCGYIDGLSSSYISCAPGLTCGALALANTQDVVVCYNPSTIGVLGSCVASADIAASCDSACQSGSLTVVCSQSSLPFCAPQTLAGVGDFYICDSTSASLTETLSTTYTGQSDTRSWQPIFKEQTTKIAPTTGGGKNTAPPPVITEPSSGGGGGGSGTNIGAIVGGAIGGFVALVAGIALLWFLLLRHKKQKTKAENANANTAPSASSPSAYGPGSYNSAGNPMSPGSYAPEAGQPPVSYYTGSEPDRGSYYQDPKLVNSPPDVYSPPLPEMADTSSPPPPTTAPAGPNAPKPAGELE